MPRRISKNFSPAHLKYISHINGDKKNWEILNGDHKLWLFPFGSQT